MLNVQQRLLNQTDHLGSELVDLHAREARLAFAELGERATDVRLSAAWQVSSIYKLTSCSLLFCFAIALVARLYLWLAW